MKASAPYGLLLAGGRSKRMGKDKAALNYHGQPQWKFALTILTDSLDKVFLSVRSDQLDAYPTEIQKIVDTGEESGPLAGIIAAQTTLPHAAWLVVACDLPFFNAQLLNHLLSQRDKTKDATAYRSARQGGLPEPLCAIYEPSSRLKIQSFIQEKDLHCPRKCLIKMDTHLLTLPDEHLLENVNHPEEFESIKKILQVTQK